MCTCLRIGQELKIINKLNYYQLSEGEEFQIKKSVLVAIESYKNKRKLNRKLGLTEQNYKLKQKEYHKI